MNHISEMAIFFINKEIIANPMQFGRASFLSHGYKYSVR